VVDAKPAVLPVEEVQQCLGRCLGLVQQPLIGIGVVLRCHLLILSADYVKVVKLTGAVETQMPLGVLH
jgi:hypothetical protein